MKTIEDILSNPPPGIDLTLVGGQALIYWTLSYRGSYPDFFPDDVISSTYDIDFVVRYHESCEICADFWQGELIQPSIDHHTPELGKILVKGESSDEDFQIDLLPDLLRIDQNSILDLRTPIDAESANPLYKNYYVLSEWGTLLNRCYNTISMKRYQGDEPLRQLRNAMAIVRSCIVWNLAAGDTHEACIITKNVLNLAAKSDVGIPLYLQHATNLIDAVPIQDPNFDERFVNFTVKQLLAKVEQKRNAWKDRQKK